MTTYRIKPTPPLTLRDSAVAYLGERSANDKPVSRLIEMGTPHALSTAELLACFFGNNTSAEADASHILSKFGGLPGIAQATVDELMGVPHIGPTRAAMMKAAFELGRRLLVESPADRPFVTSPENAVNMLMPEMELLEQEQLRVILLDTHNRVLKVHIVYIGSVNSAIVRVSEVFREAIRANATSIIMVHNHPSGDPAPSPNDVQITRSCVEAGQMLGIEVLDHLIIGRQRFVSLKNRGLGFN